jgi:hypothetical protein
MRRGDSIWPWAILSVTAVAVLFSASEAPGQSPPRSVLVAVGAGYTGGWNTEFEVANGSADSLGIVIRGQPNPSGLCPGPCPPTLAASPLGIGKVSGPFGLPPSFVGTVYLVSNAEAKRFAARARIFNVARPTQSIEIPVFQLSTLVAMNPSVLSFPSAARTPSGHSNLVLGEISSSGSLSMLVEAFSGSGQHLGSLPLSITAPPLDIEHRSIFLVDVLASLGISELDSGQIRVTKTGGDGVMWGLLATVTAEGGVAVSIGQNP